MKKTKVMFPLVHKRSTLPTVALIFTIAAAIPILMVLWVSICSQFTRVEGSNGTAFYNVYIWIRSIFALFLLAGTTVYDLRRASVALLPSTCLGVICSFAKLIINMNIYMDKKALADSMAIHSSYTQNYLDIAQSALLMITAVLMLIYLLGFFKTSFPVIFVSVITLIFISYCVISYSVTYLMDSFSVLSRSYGIPLCVGILLFCLSSKTKAQLTGAIKKEKYVPRRMKA